MHAQSMVSLLSCKNMIVIKVPLTSQSLSSYNVEKEPANGCTVQGGLGLCQVHSELWRVDFLWVITEPD